LQQGVAQAPTRAPAAPAQLNNFMQNDTNLARAIIDQSDIVAEKWLAAVLIHAARHTNPKRLQVG
jgi:hypothetical protein